MLPSPESRAARQRRGVAALLFGGLRIVPLGAEEGWRAGEWRRSFAGRGRTLAQTDCLIAAAALSLGGRLATGNPKHFPMRELAVEHWPAGESFAHRLAPGTAAGLRRYPLSSVPIGPAEQKVT